MSLTLIQKLEGWWQACVGSVKVETAMGFAWPAVRRLGRLNEIELQFIPVAQSEHRRNQPFFNESLAQPNRSKPPPKKGSLILSI